MPERAKSNGPRAASTATIGFEAKFRLAAGQAAPAPHFARVDFHGGRPQGLFGGTSTLRAESPLSAHA